MTKKYGKHEVEGELELKNAKVKVTLYIDGDILEYIRKDAKNKNKKYQTLLNDTLREYFLSDESQDMRLKTLEKQLTLLKEEYEKRISRLEAKSG